MGYVFAERVTEFASSTVKSHQRQYSIVFRIYICLRDLSSDILHLVLEEVGDGNFDEYCSGIACCRRSRCHGCRSNNYDDSSHSNSSSTTTATANGNDPNGSPLFEEINGLFTRILTRCLDVPCYRMQVLGYKISAYQKSIVTVSLTLLTCIIDVAALYFSECIWRRRATCPNADCDELNVGCC